MTPWTTRCYIAALACVARIEMMKAANAAREHRGEAQAYNEDAFGYEAQQLDRLSVEAANS